LKIKTLDFLRVSNIIKDNQFFYFMGVAYDGGFDFNMPAIIICRVYDVRQDAKSVRAYPEDGRRLHIRIGGRRRLPVL